MGAAGAAGPLVFIAVYAVATVLFVAGSILTLAGGALFGLLALGLLALVAFLPRLVARIRRRPPLTVTELARQLAGASPPLVLDVRGAEEYRGALGHIAGLPVER